MDRLAGLDCRAYVARMPDLDLGPEDYSVKGRKEPILHPNWKVGVLAIVIVFFIAVFAREVYAPAAHGFFDWLEVSLGMTK